MIATKEKFVETTPKKTKRFFDFNSHEDVPQIPRMQDIKYLLRCSSQDEYYQVSKQNKNERYLSNLDMVIEAVGNKANIEGRSGLTDEAERMIARTIVYLCPDEAACLLREAFINAKRLAGDNVPPLSASKEVLRAACSCQECEELFIRRSTD